MQKYIYIIEALFMYIHGRDLYFHFVAYSPIQSCESCVIIICTYVYNIKLLYLYKILLMCTDTLVFSRRCFLPIVIQHVLISNTKGLFIMHI